MLNYNSYPNILIGESGYPYGKAKNASGPAQVDGTPFRDTYMSDTIGWMQAFVTEASITPSGSSESTLASDILNATKFIAGELTGNLVSDSSDIAYTTEQNVKLKTFVCQSGCTEAVLTKGSNTNEANIVKVINISGATIDVNDGTNNFKLKDQQICEYYFRSSNLKRLPGNLISSVGKPEFFVNANYETDAQTHTVQDGEYFTFLRVEGAAVVNTLNIATNFVFTGANECHIIIRNNAQQEITIAYPGGSKKIKDDNTIVGRIITAGGLIEWITPRVDYSSDQSIVDPRDEFRGNIQNVTATEGTIFSFLSPFIPNTGDPCSLKGTFNQVTVTAIASHATRTSPTQITLHGCTTAGASVNQIINSGGGASRGAIFSV